MYELKITTQFAAAHQLRDFEGDCEYLHGHNWKVDVYITGEELASNGLLIDFKVIKNETKRVLDGLDHTFLNDLEPFKILNPSSENICRYIYKALSNKINQKSARVSKVTAWESDFACASYFEP